MKIKKKISYLVICLLTFFLFNNSAHAYLDPGTGTGDTGTGIKS